VEPKTVVTGVIADSAHTVGMKVVEFALQQAGFKVVSLGIETTQEEFINAAIETDASAILVSSMYGHAEFDCAGFRQKLIEAGLGKVLLYIGGNLGVGAGKKFEDVEKRFQDLGFNRVYPPGASPKKAVEDLKADLGLS
jgi:methylaspartate mutase sigma subunit